MINFAALRKTTAHIGIGDGEYIEVPLLTIADFADFTAIVNDLMQRQDGDFSEAENLVFLNEARAKILAIIERVFPEEFLTGLRRMPIDDLMKLANVLCTGKDDGETDPPEKKRPLNQ